MEKSKEKDFVCKFCNKKFPSGKSLGGHIRIHTNEHSADSYCYNGNRLMMAMKQQRQLCCRECGKGFDSLKALYAHMDCHSEGETQSDTETSSVPTKNIRSKRVMKQSSSDSFSNGSSSSASEIDQEHKNTALSLMMMSMDSKGHNLAESSENNSVILETKSSSGEQLKKILNVKTQVLETDKVAMDDHLRSENYDNGAIICDSDSSDSDYFMNGPKRTDSGISVDGSRSGFRNNDELGFKDLGTKYELRKSKRFFPCYENGTESCADTNSKNHRSSDSKSPMVKKAIGGSKKKSKGHKCPICLKVFKSGQALGGHKRSHPIENQEHRIKAAEMQIDLNLPAPDIDE